MPDFGECANTADDEERALSAEPLNDYENTADESVNGAKMVICAESQDTEFKKLGCLAGRGRGAKKGAPK